MNEEDEKAVVTAKRMVRQAELNQAAESDDKDSERKRLEEKYGQVWDVDEMGRDFEVKGFSAPLVVVRRKEDGVLGSLEFQHRPRFYFNFEEHKGHG